MVFGIGFGKSYPAVVVVLALMYWSYYIGVNVPAFQWDLNVG